MLKVCVTFDCERLISLKQGNPEWSLFQRFKGKINYLIRNFRYNEKGFELLYQEIKKQKFPCTLIIVGKLFKPIEKLDFIEWGYHSYNHVPLTHITEERLEKEVKNIYKLKSFTAPMWRIEEESKPERIYNSLKKEGYKNVTYMGKNKGYKSFFKEKIAKPEMRYGLKCIHVSNYLEGNSSKEHIKKIKKEIIDNSNKEAVYLLTGHDFTHKNVKNIMEMILFLKELERNKKIKLVKMDEA
ncbi:MAG: hypothetical protein WC867_07210 [Candidatus Pacearchaeota archaeon]|jgi:peptidoglycan/xylan/chitin deacetylase (PgdA/CDA1 family)